MPDTTPTGGLIFPAGASPTAITIPANGAGAVITLGDATLAGASLLKMLATTTHFNWLVACQFNFNDVFEITPSTAVGGNIFNTPRFTVSALANTHSTQIADSTGSTRFNAGFLESPINNQASPYTAVLADSGKTLYYTAAGAPTFTIPANSSVAYPVGTFLHFVNDASAAVNMTIAITTDTLVLSPGGTTGSRTLAQFGRATAKKMTATRWFIWGSGLT